MYLLAKAGAPVPSTHCEKKGVSCSWRLGFGDGLDVGGADGLVGVLREHGAEELVKTSSPISQRSMWKTMAPFSRVMDWNCGREGIEAAERGEGLGVVGERAGGDVGDGGLEGGFAGCVFEVHQLAVAGHAVGDPGVVEGGGRDLGAPPLVRDGVGEQTLVLPRDAGAAMATISGAQAAETVSSGSSTTLMRRGLGAAEAGW